MRKAARRDLPGLGSAMFNVCSMADAHGTTLHAIEGRVKCPLPNTCERPLDTPCTLTCPDSFTRFSWQDLTEIRKIHVENVRLERLGPLSGQRKRVEA
jgi:hypothetical protein